jgi:hypothetical protein
MIDVFFAFSESLHPRSSRGIKVREKFTIKVGLRKRLRFYG